MRISDLLNEAKELERESLVQSCTTVLSQVTSSTPFFQKCQKMILGQNGKSRMLKNIFLFLRSYYRSRSYQKSKHNEQNPDVELAHALTLAPFTESLNWKSFTHLVRPDSSESLLLNRLRDKRSHLVSLGAYEKDRSFGYMIRHPHVFLRALRSHPLGHYLLGWLFPYDPRMAENYPCMIFEEKREKGSLLFSITPTPSVGLTSSLEAEALLQAIKNRKTYSNAVLRPQLKAWVYVNLQSLLHDIEKTRSQELMKQNFRHDGLFYGITADVNSPFYKTRTDWDIEAVQSWLLHPSNYTLDTKTGHFFPIPENERKKWEEALLCVVQEASLCITQGSSAEKMAALKELAILGTIRLWQGRVFGLLGESGEILSTVACKECIDRGGKTNAQLVWALDSSEETEREMKVISLFYGRALLARKRMIQRHRSDNFFDLLHAAPQQAVSTFCQKAFSLGLAL